MPCGGGEIFACRASPRGGWPEAKRRGVSPLNSCRASWPMALRVVLMLFALYAWWPMTGALVPRKTYSRGSGALAPSRGPTEECSLCMGPSSDQAGPAPKDYCFRWRRPMVTTVFLRRPAVAVGLKAEYELSAPTAVGPVIRGGSVFMGLPFVCPLRKSQDGIPDERYGENNN